MKNKIFIKIICLCLMMVPFVSSGYAQDVIGEWNFDGNGAAVVGTDAVETGSTSYTTGVAGQALSIDAQHGYATIQGALSTVGTGPFAISAWVRYDGDFVGHVRHESPLTTYVNGSTFGVFVYSERPEVNLDRTYYSASGEQDFFEERAPWITNPNEWQHVVLGRDSSNQYLCLNGVLKSSKPITNMFNHSQVAYDTFYVGYIPFQNGGRSWPGGIDELYIYDDWVGTAGCATLFANPGVSSLDPDSDGDGVNDDVDQCPNTPAGATVDANGCSTSQLDSDNDGVNDDVDQCPDTPAGEAVNADGCSTSQLDSDDDDVFDDVDNCLLTANSNQTDTDEDGEGDACDTDDDNDLVLDVDDNCPLHENADQADFDQDGLGNICDQDDDGDMVDDGDDLCLMTAPAEIVTGQGCSINDLCPCENDWKNHGKYVSCVSKTAKNFENAGLILQTEHGTIVSAAAMSECGKKK